MINVFNRKEVCITYDMAEQARVRDILKQNNIEYDLDTKRIESPAFLRQPLRRHLGSQSLFLVCFQTTCRFFRFHLPPIHILTRFPRCLWLSCFSILCAYDQKHDWCI